MNYQFFSFVQRPEKICEVSDFTEATRDRTVTSKFGWPTFEFESRSSKKYWHRLHEEFPECQFFLCLDDRVIASCFSIPFYWQGQKENLPEGWDAVLELGFEHRANNINVNALSLLAITISHDYQGRGLSKQILREVVHHTKNNNLSYLVAPVRPVLKQFYPLAEISDYAQWKNKEGKVFDPWLRVHLGMEASLLEYAPRSLTIEGSIGEWESWTNMQFPVSGNYVIPGALSTVSISVEGDRGTYYQPNIWLQHNLDRF